MTVSSRPTSVSVRIALASNDEGIIESDAAVAEHPGIYTPAESLVETVTQFVYYKNKIAIYATFIALHSAGSPSRSVSDASWDVHSLCAHRPLHAS